MTSSGTSSYVYPQGERIRAAREHAGLTQVALAAAIEVDQGSLSLWESGKRSPATENWLRLADVLDQDLDWLIRGQPNASSQAGYAAGVIDARRVMNAALTEL